MDMKYSEQEEKALKDKIKHPESKVLCPRCGKELHWRGAGNSCEVRCPTIGCIWDIIRGI